VNMSLEQVRDELHKEACNERPGYQGGGKWLDRLADAIDAHLTRAPVQVTDEDVELYKKIHSEGMAIYDAKEREAGRAPRLQASIDAGTKHAIKHISARLAQPVVAMPTWLQGLGDSVERVRNEGDGWWVPCSGCYESEDGHASTHYPYSTELQCRIGNGCDECGGLGAVWLVWHEADENFASKPHPQAAQGGEAQGEAVGEYLANVDAHGGVRWINGKPPHGAKLYTHPAERAAVPDGWLIEFSRLLEDYVGACCETAVWNATQSIQPAEGMRFPKPRLAKLMDHVNTLLSAAPTLAGKDAKP